MGCGPCGQFAGKKPPANRGARWENASAFPTVHPSVHRVHSPFLIGKEQQQNTPYKQPEQSWR